MTLTQHREYQRFIAKCTPIPIDLFAFDMPVIELIRAIDQAGYRLKQDGHMQFYLVLREDLK